MGEAKMIWVVVYLTAIVVAGILANRYGRSVAGWVVLSALLPLVSLAILLALGEAPKVDEAKQ